jgi:hypothetical protein
VAGVELTAAQAAIKEKRGIPSMIPKRCAKPGRLCFQRLPIQIADEYALA